jgi:GNAT superfamily N-acetyltransferase
VTGGTGSLTLRRLDRAGIQPYLGLLSRWLLPDAFYSVAHTWPQLYRSDGGGTFLVLMDGERMVSHLAVREAVLVGPAGPLRAALIGSVATDPEERGRGLASRLLRQAMAVARAAGLDAALLWAERPELYRRAGFGPGRPERCALLSVEVGAASAAVRLATVSDHAAIHALHERKPVRVVRTAGVTSGLLTTPGMVVAVLEEGGEVVAYGCCGKGADLQGWWHEVGGEDAAVARVLVGGMALCGRREALVVVPPYRVELVARLGPAVRGTEMVDGPMVAAFTEAGGQACFVDGLDSV